MCICFSHENKGLCDMGIVDPIYGASYLLLCLKFEILWSTDCGSYCDLGTLSYKVLHTSDCWFWDGTRCCWWHLLYQYWRENTSEMDCSWGLDIMLINNAKCTNYFWYFIIGNILQEILSTKWCVEFWMCNVWNMEFGP